MDRIAAIVHAELNSTISNFKVSLVEKVSGKDVTLSDLSAACEMLASFLNINFTKNLAKFELYFNRNLLDKTKDPEQVAEAPSDESLESLRQEYVELKHIQKLLHMNYIEGSDILADMKLSVAAVQKGISSFSGEEATASIIRNKEYAYKLDQFVTKANGKIEK